MMHVGLCIDGTFIPSYEGATRRFVGLARYLTSRGVRVTVFHAFRGWSDMEQIAAEPFRTYFLPPDCYYHQPQALARILRREGVDALVMKNFGTIVTVGIDLKRRLPGLRLYFEVHDICAAYSRLMREPEETTCKIAQAETQAFAVADLCVCFTEQDRASILSMLDTCGAAGPDAEERVVQMPFGCDPEEIRYSGPNLAAQTVLFLGNLFHPPNALAVRFLRESVYPAVHRERPDARFLVAGPVPDEMASEYAAPGFDFVRAVSNLSTVFSQTTLAVAPIFEGTGIKVKVLDYCMAGLPVLCSTQAARGIGSPAERARAFVVEDDPHRYADHVLALLTDSTRLASLSVAAHRLSAKQNWENIIGDTIRVYDHFSMRPRRSAEQALDLNVSDDVLMPFFLKDTFRQQRFANSPSLAPGRVVIGGHGRLETIRV